MRKDEFESRNLHMRIVLIADTHNHTPELPNGDILVHAGDATMNGTREEIEKFDAWLGKLNYKHILFTPGNHDFLFERVNVLKNATVLINKGIIIDGIMFWASPYSPRFGGWAFMKSENELAEIWRNIPDKVDVLITHGPPKGMLDKTISGENAGPQFLLERTREVKPKVHVFGHIHETYGSHYNCEVRYINASVLNEYYQNVNEPIVIDIGV